MPAPDTTSTPVISIVIPTYGRPASTRRAVESALAQGVDSEIVIVDDGSPVAFDPAGLSPRVKVVRLNKNRGAAFARSTGVAAARAGWIAFLDSDDAWAPQTLAPRLQLALDDPNPDDTIWCAGFQYVSAGRPAAQARLPRASQDPRDFASGCWSCPGSTALFSRKAWDASAGQDAALRRLEDYDWLLRWGLAGRRLATAPLCAAWIHRGGRAELTTITAAARHLEAKFSGLSPNLKRRLQAYLSLERAAAAFGEGKLAVGTLEMVRSLALKPRFQPALEPFWTPAVSMQDALNDT